MLFCLTHESPAIDETERKEIDRNEMLTAHQGRDPDLKLTRNGKDISIKEWGGEILGVMQGYASLLDDVHGTDNYSCSLKKQKQAVDDPECTPSAKMLCEMREKGEGFYHFATRMSEQHHEAFLKDELSAEQSQFYQDLSRTSLAQQKEMEDNDSLPFATFLQRYFDKLL